MPKSLPLSPSLTRSLFHSLPLFERGPRWVRCETSALRLTDRDPLRVASRRDGGHEWPEISQILSLPESPSPALARRSLWASLSDSRPERPSARRQLRASLSDPLSWRLSSGWPVLMRVAGTGGRTEAGLSRASIFFGRLCKLLRIRSPDCLRIRSADVTRRLHMRAARTRGGPISPRRAIGVAPRRAYPERAASLADCANCSESGLQTGSESGLQTLPDGCTLCCEILPSTYNTDYKRAIH